MGEIDRELQKYGLDREKYELCIKDIRDKINGVNDMDWAEIVEKYRLPCHSDTLRKSSQTIFGGKFVADYFAEKDAMAVANEGYLVQLRLEKRDLQVERQKLRDEKLEYNRWLREQSRDELICEKICDEVRQMQPLEFPKPRPHTYGHRESVLCFADAHYGTEFKVNGLLGDTINEYSPEVFEKRMLGLLEQVIDTIEEKKLTAIKVFSLGDELDGILRVSQLMKMRYGVVESTIKYSEFISNWLNELSKYAAIDFYSVQGNHSELRMIAQPKGTFTEENMAKIINEFIKERLKSNPNFTFRKNESGLIFENICGYNVLGIHGEVKNLETAIQRFTNMYNVMIDILVGGHKHHFGAETVGHSRDVISVPSIIGIDDYAMSIGKTSNPGALMFTIESGKGVIEQRSFKL